MADVKTSVFARIFFFERRDRLIPHVIAWQESETDEFTQRAISHTLDALDERSNAQTALALEVARSTTAIGREMAQRERLNRELEIAQEVKAHLFPQHLPPVAGLDYCGQCRPARDRRGLLRLSRLPEGRLGIAIGDVSGKGIGAALLMASPLVSEASSANRYATLFYAEYDPRTLQLSYVNAGHNPPIVLRHSATACEVMRLETGGPVIGLLRHSYQQEAFPLRTGDQIVLFTDGISESMNTHDEEWGENRLIQCVKNCRELSADEAKAKIFAAADAFSAGASQHDDMTLVVLRVFAS